MLRGRNWLVWGLILMVVALSLTNPSEYQFLRRVSSDYGAIHHGKEISISELQKMGSSHRTSYLLFSFYAYRFGQIKVEYFGLAGMMFFLSSSIGSSHDKPGEIRV